MKAEFGKNLTPSRLFLFGNDDRPICLPDHARQMRKGDIMGATTTIFEKHYQHYCAQLAQLDIERVGDILGLIRDGDRSRVTFFGQPY